MSNNSLTKTKITKKLTKSVNLQNQPKNQIQKSTFLSNQNLDQDLSYNLTNNLNQLQNKIEITQNNDFLPNLQKEYQTVGQIIAKFQDFPKVTFYGGANVGIDSKDYKEIQTLANSLSECGFVVASGGGPGIMAAAISGGNGQFEPKNCTENDKILQNKFSKNKNQAEISNKNPTKTLIKRQTLGLRMNLVSEPPPFLGTFDYLFTDFAPRKLALRSSDVLIFAPGGFGTLDELMEILTLLKTKKMSNKQVFLYNSDFWTGLLSWICQKIMTSFLAAEEFLQYFVVCDKTCEILEMIKNSEIYKTNCQQNSCFLTRN